ncbi:MAG: hypothetical protein V4553_16425 [Bacteroidota bacterium]
MKKVLLVCAFVIGVSAVSFAQGGGRMRMKPEEQTANLKKTLTDLNDDQSAKITAIYTVAAKKRDSLMTAARDAGGDRQAMMASFMKMSTETDTKIKAVLTADQVKAYQKVVDERAERMKAMQNGN